MSLKKTRKLAKLNFVNLMPLITTSHVPPLVASILLASNLDSDMVVDNVLVSSVPPPSISFDVVADFSSSSSKILTIKVEGLE
ncbi:hypothetical protein G9A89_017348 [Geosiphon pyriformis]|nr:hypothetical protein G9A89_017348 [Geosiphon pyriformis]